MYDVDINMYVMYCVLCVCVMCCSVFRSHYVDGISWLPSFFHVFTSVFSPVVSWCLFCFCSCLGVCVCVCVCVYMSCPCLPFLFFASSSSHSLFSLSNPEFRSPSHGGNLNRSASLSCTERAPESGSVGGSITQIPGTPFQYIPDFCVRALTDLQFVKVTFTFTKHQSANTAVFRQGWKKYSDPTNTLT